MKYAAWYLNDLVCFFKSPVLLIHCGKYYLHSDVIHMKDDVIFDG